MYDELVKNLREVEEMLKVAQFKEAANLIDQAADAIEKMSAYVQQIEELRKDGYYLEKTEMTPYGQRIITGLLPRLWEKVVPLHVDEHGVVSIPEEEERVW